MSLKVGFKNARNIILGVILVSVAFGSGYYFGVKGFKAEVTKSLQVKISQEVPPDINVNMDLFWAVWRKLDERYYDKSKIVPSQMVYGAISGMVNSLGDPFTMFLTPNQNKTVNEDLSGSLEGVGIQIGFDKSGILMVQSPLPGSPAEKAGIKAGDYIVRIKDVKKNIDVDTAGINLSDAVSKIRGPAGSVVTLTVARKGSDKPLTFDLTRAKLDIPSVTLTLVGDSQNIADIKINSFDAQTPDEWNKVVDQIIAKGNIKGVVIDLRNNPGGYLQDAIDLAGDFLESGTVVVREEDQNGLIRCDECSTTKSGRLLGVPVVLLINGGSASASEILSGALRDQIKAKLVGEKSFGKGTVQSPIDLDGGAGLHVTVAKWLTPNGTWVHGVGLTPDMVVENISATEDAQLNKAISLFK